MELFVQKLQTLETIAALTRGWTEGGRVASDSAIDPASIS
jgi:hypothetical protein